MAIQTDWRKVGASRSRRASGQSMALAARGLRRWFVAVAVAFVALELTLVLLPLIEPTAFVLFFAAISVSAWYGGLGPGLVTTVLSAWSIHQFIHPPGLLTEYHVDDFIRLALFVGVAALISSLGSRLQRAADPLRALVQASPLAIVTLDPDGCVTGWNGAAERMFGWPADEALGRRLPFLPEGGEVEFLALRDRVLAGGTLRGVEVRRRKRDGTGIDISIWAAPLHDAQGRITGALSVLEDITERKRAREAIEKARRQAEEAYAREHRIAARFQGALQPSGDVCVRGYAVAHSYRPALVEADVGGDFYNVFNADSRYVVLVMGDVGGKGLEAAVVAFRVQQSALALAGFEPLHPETVLEGVRRAFLSFAEVDSLVTLLMAVVDRDTGRLRYASAGHEPPLVRRALTREVEVLAGHGPAIHSLSSAAYMAHETVLDCGDVLLLYTDGLPDARRRSRDPLGTERLVARVAACPDAEPEAMMASLYDAAIAHSAGDLRDDIAIVGVRRLEDPSAGRYVFVEPPRNALPFRPHR